jgi:hypothetical protein
MKQFRYISAQVQGNSPPVCIDLATGREVDLQSLFREGWKPLRELPMGATGGDAQEPTGFVLLMMERN